MLTFLASFLIIAAALLAMAVGVLLGRRPVAGSCGGLSRMGIGVSCMLCEKPCRRATRGSTQECDR